MRSHILPLFSHIFHLINLLFQLTCGNVRREETKFMDLNFDCQLMILNEMSLSSLVSFSQTNKMFSALIADILNRRFAKSTVSFEISGFHGEMDKNVNESGNVIKIQQSKLILNILKRFGQFITELEIKICDMQEKNIQLIKKSIAHYCSDTLKELRIINKHEQFDEFFDAFSTPFKNVSSVSLSGKFQALGNSMLNKTFPSMRRLTLSSLEVFDMSWINQTVPNLVDVHINIWNSATENYANEEATGTFLKNNPQIQNLMLKNARLKLLDLLSDEMSSLENLTLASYIEFSFHDVNHELHFDSVKFLKMQMGYRTVPKNLFLKNIEVFETDAFPSDCSRWIEFVDKHKHLKTLRITYYLKTEQIRNLASIKPNLIEISLKLYDSVDVESVIELIENSQRLEKILLQLPWKDPDSVVKLLDRRCGNQWITTRLSYLNASMERKQ